MVQRIIKIIRITIITILFFPLFSEATTSRLINFQGRLTDQQGNSLEGTYNLKFSLYPSPDSNASPLWTEEHANVSASKGIVNVLLGSIRSFDEPVKVTFDQERYLGITIDCDHDPNTKEPEMTPRQRILPAIYAYTADSAHNADNAYNADKLDGKDSSEYTTPEKDAGRPGVVENLYEGNIRLIDKYIKADKLWGISQSLSLNTVYQAESDGFLFGGMNVGDESVASNFIVYSDANNQPTTLYQRIGKERGTLPCWLYLPFNVPIRKGDYYLLRTEGSPSVKAFWMPVGN